MSISQFVSEFVRLIKDNVGFLLKCMLSISVLLFIPLFLFFSDIQFFEQQDEVGDSLEATFDVYIENEDYTAFGNSYLLEVLILNPDLLEKFEEKSGVPIQPVIDEYAEENELYYTEDDPINIERNTSSNLLEFSVDLGDSEKNLQVAETIKEWIKSTDVSFLENKNIYIMTEPELDSDLELISSGSHGFSYTTVIRLVIIVLTIAVLISLVILLLKEFFNDSINYSFSYITPIDMAYLNMSNTNPKVIAHNILRNSNNRTYILSQNTLSNQLSNSLNELDTDYTVVNNMSELPIENHISKVTLIINKGDTTKQWFKDQMSAIRLLVDCEVLIVEL